MKTVVKTFANVQCGTTFWW